LALRVRCLKGRVTWATLHAWAHLRVLMHRLQCHVIHRAQNRQRFLTIALWPQCQKQHGNGLKMPWIISCQESLHGAVVSGMLGKRQAKVQKGAGTVPPAAATAGTVGGARTVLKAEAGGDLRQCQHLLGKAQCSMLAPTNRCLPLPPPSKTRKRKIRRKRRIVTEIEIATRAETETRTNVM